MLGPVLSILAQVQAWQMEGLPKRGRGGGVTAFGSAWLCASIQLLHMQQDMSGSATRASAQQPGGDCTTTIGWHTLTLWFIRFCFSGASSSSSLAAMLGRPVVPVTKNFKHALY